jgi:hypothetical protein
MHALRFSRLLVLLAAAGVLGNPPARADNQYLEIPSKHEARSSRAYRYANLTNRAAAAELAARGIRYVRATPPLPGVRFPIRLKGRLHGVLIRSSA